MKAVHARFADFSRATRTPFLVGDVAVKFFENVFNFQCSQHHRQNPVHLHCYGVTARGSDNLCNLEGLMHKFNAHH